jgi:hypothetical protein
MTRLNRKRLDTLESLTRNEIAMRLGRAWDIVQRVAAEAELTIPPEPDAEPEPAPVDEWALLDELTL